jgi:class 3 adenylate cyclase
MIKKAFFIIILFPLFYGTALNAQKLSPADSAIYYLKQIKGLGTSDSVLMMKAAAAILSLPPDSLPVDKIESELKVMLPVIPMHYYFMTRLLILNVLASGTNTDRAINYSKSLFDELKNYSGTLDQEILLGAIARSRFLYRNSNRINDGVDYFQHLANYFEQAHDTIVTSWCYWALSGFYNALGLIDKSIYCQMKSINFIPRNKIANGNNILGKFNKEGLLILINRKSVLGCILLENGSPEKALPLLFEAKNIFEAIKDSVVCGDAPFIYLQIIRAKMITEGDSIPYYFDQLKKIQDLAGDPSEYPNYYQELGHYYYLQNQLDSAEYFISRSKALKDSLKIMINAPFGIIIPGYYFALIKIKQNKFPEAISLLQEESKELLKVNLRKTALKEWLLLTSAYKHTGDFRNATATLEQYNLLQNKITEDENKSRSVSFETEQQINLLNAEKQKQNQEIDRQKLFRNLTSGGLAVVVMFSILFLFQRNRISKEKKRSEELLLNILPYQVAEELKQTGHYQAKTFSMVTVMFMDFKDFTRVSERVSAELLVDEINFCFSAFDNIIQKYKVEKIKTIGDAYICVGGLPVLNYTHASDIINTAIEIRDFMIMHKKEKEDRGEIPFELRIGIHTGPVVAGIVGVKKFQYDIWGDTVNLAARMEQNSEAGMINISGSTYTLVKDKFTCSYRGKIQAKNKGEVDMYFVENIKQAVPAQSMFQHNMD